MAAQIKEFIDEGLVNIVGGCCGTTPEHIARYREITQNASPRRPIAKDNRLHICGLEGLVVCPENNFVNIGERCNVAGSRKFLRLIHEKNYTEALDIARKQVEAGAQIIDINMDDANARCPQRDGRLLESHRLRARHLSGSCNDRLFRMGGYLRRPEMSARESHRQLHQPERRRRNIPRACP